MQSGGEANHKHRKVRRFAILVDLSEVVLAKIFIGDSCRCCTPLCTSAGPPHYPDYNPYCPMPPAPLQMPYVAPSAAHTRASRDTPHTTSSPFIRRPTANVLAYSNTTTEPPRSRRLHPTTLHCWTIALGFTGSSANGFWTSCAAAASAVVASAGAEP